MIDNFLSFLPKKIKKFKNGKKEYIPTQTFIKNTDVFYIKYSKFCNFHFKNWNKKIKKKNELKNTIYYNFDFNFHFKEGSKESLLFLNKYKNSKNSKFILSPFRHIINEKWKKIKIYFLILSIIYWLHIIIFSIFIINPKKIIFLIIDIILLIILLCHEIISYFLNKKLYFSQITNYLDFSMIIFSFINLVISHKKKISIKIYYHIYK